MDREDKFITFLTVVGADAVKKDTGSWDKFSGGETDSDATNYKPAGMPRRSLGGVSEVGNITLSRLYDEASHALTPWLRAQCGRGRVTVIRQPLDNNDQPFGKPEVFTGTLKGCTPPDSDSESNDAALLEVEIAPDSTVS